MRGVQQARFAGIQPRTRGWSFRSHGDARWASVASTVALLLVVPVSTEAVLFHSTADPDHNTAPPGGELAGSGWDLQGRWGRFLGTPIAPRYFITAAHVGGSIGDAFTLGGVAYTTTAFFDDPGTDLRIWRVREVFPAYAVIHGQGIEQGKRAVLFGRGTQRGEEVQVLTNGEWITKGWRWGVSDQRLRWGENTVEEVLDGDLLSGATGIGEVLKLNFDRAEGEDECHLSNGDSGGALFLRHGTAWELAGINYSVDGPYRLRADSGEINAALVDRGGLYEEDEDGWGLVPDLPADQPGAMYATRIASRVDWINGIISQVLPAPTLQWTGRWTEPFVDDADAQVDPENRTIRTIVTAAGARFYRLRGLEAHWITSWRVEGSSLVITYQ